MRFALITLPYLIVDAWFFNCSTQVTNAIYNVK